MSNKRLGIGEAISVFFALAGLGIQLRWPEQKWLGTAFIILGVACGIGIIVWVIAQRVALKQVKAEPSDLPLRQQIRQAQSVHAPVNNTFEPHTTFAPTINLNQSQSQTQKQATPERRRTPPTLGIRSSTVEKCLLDKASGEVANLYRRTVPDPDFPQIEMDVVFVKLFRQDSSEEAFVDVNGAVYFMDSEGKVVYTTDHAFWYSNEGYHKRVKTFTQGDTGRLIIGTIPKPGILLPYSGDYVTVASDVFTEVKVFRADSAQLQGEKFTVRAALVGTRGGYRILRENFDYELTTTESEQSIKFIKATNYLRSDEYP